MKIVAWGEEKDVMDFLEDGRVDPSLTRDVIVKRIKRGEVPEYALTKPVCEENKAGDTKKRRERRKEKFEQRTRMFLLAQEVRKRYDAGADALDTRERYEISKSQYEKFISGNEYYNIHWKGSSVPERFKETAKKIRGEKR